jgi:Helix-turn-helix domain of resolvase
VTRPRKDVEDASDLLAQGLPIAEVARRVGIARATVRDWASAGFDEIVKGRANESGKDGRCGFCRYVRNLSETSYAYLLGLYLGDGWITGQP